jgi:hypothetical protein
MTHGQERRSRTGNAPVGDDLDRLGADTLLSYLTDAARWWSSEPTDPPVAGLCWDSRDCSATTADLMAMSTFKEMR